MRLEIFALATIGVLILRDKTKQDYLSALKCHVFPKLGNHEMESITKKDIQEVVQEVTELKLSERATRLIDGDKEDSMEKKKTEGYF